MKKKLVLIGGGGHCNSCIEVINQLNQYEILGILDPNITVGSLIAGYKILGGDDLINEYIQAKVEFLITLGQIKTAKIRAKLLDKLLSSGAILATIISPKAYVSSTAILGNGTIVMHNVTVNANVTIGMNCILNTSCNIEHDTSIGNNCHISTGVMVNGSCDIGDAVFVGSNATISNNIIINDNIVIGLGTIIYKNLIEEGIYKQYTQPFFLKHFKEENEN